jgi:hypothetical protein
MLTKAQTPAQERAQAARQAAKDAEAGVKAARAALDAHGRETERQRGEWDTYRRNGGQEMFDYSFPSVTEARERGVRRLHLESEVRTAEEALRLAEARAAAAEKRAAPLSKVARARLEELVGWAVADAELAEVLGANPCEVLVSPGGKDRILAFARDCGVEVSR